MTEMEQTLMKKLVAGNEDRPEGGWNKDKFLWLMEQSGVTMKELSEATGVKEGTIRTYINRNSSPSVDTVVRFANYFHIPVDYLLGRCTVRESGEIFDNFADYFSALRSADYGAYLVNKYARDDTIRSKYVSTWPFNLIEGIYRVEGKNECIEFDMDGLEEAISTLTPREIKAIDLRYRKEMSLEEVGEACGVGQERIRQITAKACRKLRHPSRMKLIMYGKAALNKKMDLEDKEKELESLARELEQREANIKERERELEIEREERETMTRDGLDDSLEEMELTVRAYNCMARTGCRTVRDVAELVSKGNLLKVRNVGIHCANEILHRLKDKYGVDYFNLYVEERWIR